jgi:hypothetical protein
MGLFTKKQDDMSVVMAAVQARMSGDQATIQQADLAALKLGPVMFLSLIEFFRLFHSSLTADQKQAMMEEINATGASPEIAAAVRSLAIAVMVNVDQKATLQVLKGEVSALPSPDSIRQACRETLATAARICTRLGIKLNWRS